MLRAFRAVHRYAYQLWVAMLAVRVALLIALLGVIAFDAAIIRAQSASPAQPSMSSNARAYDITLVCYVVALDGRVEADHARALDGVRKMAKVLGYDDKRMSDDIFKMTTVLGARTRSDPTVISRNREGCRRLGLIS